METLPPTTLPLHEARRLWVVAVAAAGSDDSKEAVFRTLERRRIAGEPLQYLEGTAAFGPLDLMVDERVLIPRPETEGLWELAVSLVDRPSVAVDLGTGSGALALMLARVFPGCRVLGVDLSQAALDVARENAARNRIEVEFRQGDLWEGLPQDVEGSVDLIVSNPPYVSTDEWDALPPDVRAEPRTSLVAGHIGTEVLARIARSAHVWLTPGGWVACEIGETQGDVCHTLFEQHLSGVEIRQDLTGRDRYVIGRRP